MKKIFAFENITLRDACVSYFFLSNTPVLQRSSTPFLCSRGPA
jgi:hypothetical protein